MIPRVGPFEVSSTVRAVPGARFYAARDGAGEVVLLQVAFLRPAADGEAEARSAEERRIATTTAALGEADPIRVQAHGASGLEDGRRLLWWRLAPHDPGALLGTLAPHAWVEEAQGLLSRLLARHRAGTRAPLLTEQALFRGEAGLDWLGVAVAPVPAWAGSGAPPPRSAPDERAAPTPRGDLWRLGQALGALVEPEGLSTAWGRWLDGLRHGAFEDAEAAFAAVPSKVVPRPRVGSLATVRWGPPEVASAAESVEPQTSAERPSTPPPAVDEPALDFQTVTERALSVLAEQPVPPDLRTTAEVLAVPGEPAPAMSSEEQAAVEALAMSWSQPPMPTGESPWSDVELAPLLEPEPDSGIRVAPVAAPVSGAAPEEPPPPPRAVSGFEPRRAAFGVLALLVVFGTIAFFARPAPEASVSAPMRVAASGRSVRLDSDPPGASVIARRDGRVLGRTPLDFLVASAEGAEVLVQLDGHEPTALTLPDRGAVTVRLPPMDRALDCEVAWGASAAAEAWPSGAPVGDRLAIDGGATIVRARPSGGRVGARLVRCPALGGEARAAPRFAAPMAGHRLRIAQPVGAEVTVDGRPLGPAPVEVRTAAAFVRVEVERLDAGGARWVPIVGDTEVHVPVTERSRPPPLELDPDGVGLASPPR